MWKLTKRVRRGDTICACMARLTDQSTKEGTLSQATEPKSEPTVLNLLAWRIRATRANARLTQRELAGDRYTKAYVSAIERGLAQPSLKALDYLARRLGTTCAALLANDHPADQVRTSGPEEAPRRMASPNDGTWVAVHSSRSDQSDTT